MAVVAVDIGADGVATLTLNRPEKRNALSIELRDAVTAALSALAGDAAVRCVVLTGVGDTFSAGFDLGEFAVDAPGFQEELWASSDRFHHAVLRFPLPLIAAVNGPALAGGFDLAVMCDVRLASITARFAHPETTFGDVVYGPLRELVGGGIARDLALTGRAIDALEAQRLGLVSVVVEPGQLAATAAEWAAMVCRAPREILLRTKAKIVDRAAVDPGTRTLDL